MAAGGQQFELADPPQDGITALSFSPTVPQSLLASSWDGTVRLYDTSGNRLVGTIEHQGPVLDVRFAGSAQAVSGGLDGSVNMIDIAEARVTQVLGTHDDAVKAVVHVADVGAVVSGSWDKTLRVWDARGGAATLAARLDMPDKVYTMDASNNRLVVGTANRHVLVFDVRNLSAPIQRRESALKFQTRCIRCFPTNDGFAISTIEGRVAVEYFEQEDQAKKFAFKCHRVKNDSGEIVYPVNALAFHPSFGTFVTGGCDGCVMVWDGNKRKRVRVFPSYPSSIAALAFSCDGKSMAVASSYTFEEGEKDHPADAIFIRSITETDMRLKA